MTDPAKLDLLRRLFSDDPQVRRQAMQDAANQQPVFSSPHHLAAALITLTAERINQKKGGENSGQQQQSPHQA